MKKKQSISLRGNCKLPEVGDKIKFIDIGYANLYKGKHVIGEVIRTRNLTVKIAKKKRGYCIEDNVFDGINERKDVKMKPIPIYKFVFNYINDELDIGNKIVSRISIMDYVAEKMYGIKNQQYIDNVRKMLSHCKYLSEGDGSGCYKILKHIPEDTNLGKLKKQCEHYYLMKRIKQNKYPV